DRAPRRPAARERRPQRCANLAQCSGFGAVRGPERGLAGPATDEALAGHAALGAQSAELQVEQLVELALVEVERALAGSGLPGAPDATGGEEDAEPDRREVDQPEKERVAAGA